MKKLLPILGCLFLGILIMPAVVEHPAKDNAQEEGVKMEARRLLEALTQYHGEFGAYPPGDSSQVIRELGGDNPEKKVFFECPADKLNEKGELLDPWGTPYRMIPSTGTALPIIHSAGKNRLFEAASAKRADDYRTRHDHH